MYARKQQLQLCVLCGEDHVLSNCHVLCVHSVLHVPLHSTPQSDGACEEHFCPTITCCVHNVLHVPMYSTYLYTPLHSDGAGEDHVLSNCHVFSGSLVYVRRRNITEIKNIWNKLFSKLTFSISVSLQFLILHITLCNPLKYLPVIHLSYVHDSLFLPHTVVPLVSSSFFSLGPMKRRKPTDLVQLSS